MPPDEMPELQYALAHPLEIDSPELFRQFEEYRKANMYDQLAAKADAVSQGNYQLAA